MDNVEHWIFRVGDGDHFWSSSKYNIWGIDSQNKSTTQPFITSVKSGDLLWFVKGGDKGKLIAVSTFTELKKREVGPLISLTLTDEELGWTKSNQGGNSDTEIHYKDLYDLTDCGLFSEIKSPLVIRKYSEKCKVNLPAEYPYIVKYSKAKRC
jgi:hypothetical protein